MVWYRVREFAWKTIYISAIFSLCAIFSPFSLEPGTVKFGSKLVIALSTLLPPSFYATSSPFAGPPARSRVGSENKELHQLVSYTDLVTPLVSYTDLVTPSGYTTSYTTKNLV